jgi:hypothetical protein
MTDEQFKALCNTYGFAPSRALRELIDCAVARQEILEEVTAQRDALLKMLKDVLPVAEDASESLGRFCSNEGWAQEDMDRMDNVDGMLPLIRAAIAAVEGEKE